MPDMVEKIRVQSGNLLVKNMLYWLLHLNWVNT